MFLGQTLVKLGCSALSVFESDQETIFDQPDCGWILFFKMILSYFESFMKVLVLYVYMNLVFWIAWFWYQKLKIFLFEYLLWKQIILPREEFWPEVAVQWGLVEV